MFAEGYALAREHFGILSMKQWSRAIQPMSLAQEQRHELPQASDHACQVHVQMAEYASLKMPTMDVDWHAVHFMCRHLRRPRFRPSYCNDYTARRQCNLVLRILIAVSEPFSLYRTHFCGSHDYVLAACCWISGQGSMLQSSVVH